MFKLIKSWMAATAHMKALNLLSNQHQTDALAQMSRAIKLETSNEVLPKHLVYKADIEYGLGMFDQASNNYKKAFELTERYPKYWSKPENSAILKKIKDAVENNV